MSIVCTTAVITIEPQELTRLKQSQFVHQSHKKLRRTRKHDSFKHVIWRMPTSRVVFLIYGSGKVVILGTTSVSELQQASEWLVSELGSKIIEAANVSNIVYACKRDLSEMKISLPDIYHNIMKHGDGSVRYEPELSPALIFKPMSQSATAMIFRTGNITITGLKSNTDIANICTSIDTLLNRYRSFSCES